MQNINYQVFEDLSILQRAFERLDETLQQKCLKLIEQKQKTKKQKNDHRHDNMREELMYRHEKSVRFKTSDLDKKA